ncbi:hypothetical protein LXL04_006900 [Taraxacum kok-saghyz]
MLNKISEVAVKRLRCNSKQRAHEFEAEVQVLSKLRHGNLVSLIGYCNEGSVMALVYELMPNGTLEDNLHKPDSSLSWLQLLKHHTGTSTQHGVIHRDVKSSNSLLDAKIADFGLAKVGLIDETQTHVSMAVKKDIWTGQLTIKSDVYAFGVVLFEVFSRRKALDSATYGERWGLAGWAQHQIKEGKLNQIIDPRLIGHVSKKCLKEFASIANRCLDTQPKKRPTMAEVVVKLESILSQEREIAKSVVDEKGFVYKLRSFFTTKVDATIFFLEQQSEVDAAITNKSNQSIKIFTYDELENATYGFKYKEYSQTLEESIYKGWVHGITYAPTEYGVGLAIYVRKMEIESRNISIILTIKLFGYCFSNHKLYCVYEVKSGITLDKYLYEERERES